MLFFILMLMFRNFKKQAALAVRIE